MGDIVNRVIQKRVQVDARKHFQKNKGKRVAEARQHADTVTLTRLASVVCLFANSQHSMIEANN